MLAFFYSSNDVLLPIFVRKVFGHKNFVSNAGFLWLSYPVGSVLITILVKTLFGTIHTTGLLVFIAFFQFLGLYSAHAMKNAHKNYLLKQVETINRNIDESPQEVNANNLEPASSIATENRTANADIEEKIEGYRDLDRRLSKAVLSL